jgi:hypothetical protein
MPGENGVGIPLVLGVGGVGQELKHPGVMEGEEVVLVFGGSMSGVFAEAEASAPWHARGVVQAAVELVGVGLRVWFWSSKLKMALIMRNGKFSELLGALDRGIR